MSTQVKFDTVLMCKRDKYFMIDNWPYMLSQTKTSQYQLISCHPGFISNRFDDEYLDSYLRDSEQTILGSSLIDYCKFEHGNPILLLSPQEFISKLAALHNMTVVSNAPDSKLLVQFVKRKNRRSGVVVAFKENGITKLGWSLCNMKLDKFDRDKAIKIAKNRAIPIINIDTSTLSRCLSFYVMSMSFRAKNYFKK